MSACGIKGFSYGLYDPALEAAIRASRQDQAIVEDPDLALAIRLSLEPTRKVAPVIDEQLVKTTFASSRTCDGTLFRAIENAKKTKNLKIVAHKVERNELGNAYLVLTFSHGVGRESAIAELGSKHQMFKIGETINRIGINQLAFTVEQTIAFCQKF